MGESSQPDASSATQRVGSSFYETWAKWMNGLLRRLDCETVSSTQGWIAGKDFFIMGDILVEAVQGQD